jgi:paraquat-inducible protein B
MNELLAKKRTDGSLPRAKIKRTRSAWLLWIVPIAAAALCVWFVYRDFVATGPSITIYFENAEGLVAGDTPVRYRGAQVGMVKDLELEKNNQSVKATVRLIGSAKDLARAGSVFWIVRPELKLGAISGLNTIISGEYLTVNPGHGPPTNTFAGADKAPVAEGTNGLRVVLLAPNLSSLQEQSPIFYRGIQVGKVLHFQLGTDAQEVVIQALIDAEYAPLVRRNSKFWNAGGIDVHVGLFSGADISATSPRTLISGGIEFATPTDFAEPATNGLAFRLYEEADDDWKNWKPAIPLHLPESAPRTTTPKPASLLK